MQTGVTNIMKEKKNIFKIYILKSIEYLDFHEVKMQC